MSYTSDSGLTRQYYHSSYLPYQTHHATGLSSTQRPHSGPSSAPDPATFDFPSGTIKYDCPWCDKSYAGPNGRSVWRRHAQEKHNLPCNSRKSRWDAHPERPKNQEDKKDRNLACKRQWAKDNRIKKRLLKQLNSISPFNPERNKIQADLEHWARRRRSQSVEKENIDQSTLPKSAQSTPIFAPMSLHAAANRSFDYSSDLSGWSTASQESSLPGLEAFDHSLSEEGSSYAVSQDGDVSHPVQYPGAHAALMPYAPPSPPHSPSPDDAVFSDEEAEAEEMMQFVERYSSIEPPDDEVASENALGGEPILATNEARNNDAQRAAADVPPPVQDIEIDLSTSIDYSAAHVGAITPFPLAQHLILRQAIWKREQEEAEDECRVEESLFAPGADLHEDDDYGFDKPLTSASLSSPIRSADSSLDSSFDSVKLMAATPRFAKLNKSTDSPFHLKPVETTPDKRRLAWELGLAAESSPGSGYYLAQVQSAVAGRWVDEF